MVVTIYYIELEGSVAVIQSPKNIESNIAYAESRLGIEDSSLTKRATDIFDQASKDGLLQTAEFEVNPYTYGQKLDAQKKSTVYAGGDWKADPSTMNKLLIIAATGKTEKEIDALKPAIAQALWEEIITISEPDADRLLFLLAKRTTGASAVQSQEK